MDLRFIFVVGWAVAALCAGVYAVVADRFRMKIAGGFAVLGGTLPLLALIMLFTPHPPGLIEQGGLFVSSPAFVVALFLNWLGPREPGWEKTTVALFVGFLAAFMFLISFGSLVAASE